MLQMIGEDRRGVEGARRQRECARRWAMLLRKYPREPWLDLQRRFYDWLYQDAL